MYAITCKICLVQYVSRTTRQLKVHLHNHLYDIAKWHSGGLSAVSIQIIEKIWVPKRGGNVFLILCKREVNWMFWLHTHKPDGLDFEWDVTHYCEWVFPMDLPLTSPCVFPFLFWQYWCICIHIYIYIFVS